MSLDRQRRSMGGVGYVSVASFVMSLLIVCGGASAQPAVPTPPPTHEPAEVGDAKGAPQGGVVTLGDAERALAAGDVPGAIRAHEALLAAHGPQPDLYYNLGLLYGVSEDWAAAALNLERARALEPDAADVQAHLGRVKEALGKAVMAASPDRQISQGEPRAFGMWRLFHALSPGVVGGLLLGGVLVGFGALTARRYVGAGPWRDGAAVVGVLGLVVGGVAGAYALGQAQTDGVRPAFVMAQAPRLYNAPLPKASTEVPPDLYRGVMVEVLEARGDWRHVALPDGTEGWLPAQDVADVRVERWRP